MPSLIEGPQSPFLKSIFSRRDLDPLYVSIPLPAEVAEKHSLPVIVLTPSTPTDPDAPPPVYPAGRLPQPNARLYFCDDDGGDIEQDFTLKPVSRWGGPRISSRTVRLIALMGFMATIALLHYLVIRVLALRDEEITTTNTKP